MTTRTPDPEALLTAVVGHIRSLLDILTRGGNGDPLSVGRAQAFLDAATPSVVSQPLTTEAVTAALQAAWEDYLGDTDCFPDCFKISRGPELYADFRVGNFAQMVAAHMNSAQPATCNEGLQVGDTAGEIARLTAELKASGELLALVSQSIVEASDLINSDPQISPHFTQTAKTFAEIVEFAREWADKPTGALGGLDARWADINRADRTQARAEALEEAADLIENADCISRIRSAADIRRLITPTTGEGM